jgi:hypothetical protein
MRKLGGDTPFSKSDSPRMGFQCVYSSTDYNSIRRSIQPQYPPLLFPRFFTNNDATRATSMTFGDNTYRALRGVHDGATLQDGARNLKHKRRYCRTDGCHRIVKSQGLCQRHGAKPKKCKIDECPKQAQGNFHGMCSKFE